MSIPTFFTPTIPPAGEQRPRAIVGRKRRWVGWSLLILGVLATHLWLASRWWSFGYGGSLWGGSIRQGMCSLTYLAPANPNPQGWRVQALPSANRRWEWRVPAQTSSVAPPLKIVADHHLLLIACSQLEDPGVGLIVRSYELVLWPLALLPLIGGVWLLWWSEKTRQHKTAGH